MAGMDLGKKIGPLPLGGWVIVVGAGLGVGILINRNAKKATDTPSQVVDPSVGTGGGSFLPINPPDTSTGDALPETNQSWGNKAITWLIASQIDPVVANSAVNKFLTGMTLSAQESAAIAMALGKYGPPPEGTSAPPDNPKPATPGNLSITMRTNNAVGLAWSPVSGADKYEVIANSSHGSWAPQNTLIPSWNSGPKLGSNLDHTFYVRAINEFGKSEPAQISAKTATGPTVGIIPPKPPKPPAVPPKPVPPKPATQRTYSIVAGDTLQKVSSRFYGTNNRWITVYNANAGALEAAARAHGKASSRGPTGVVGWWIYPGTRLVIP